MIPTMRAHLPMALVAALVLLAACSAPLQPDLARLYRVGAGNVDTTPVIVIPGLFGSRLRDRTTGVEVWPGSWSDLLFGDYRGLALTFDAQTLEVQADNLEAYGLAEQVLGQDYYGPIIRTLQGAGGYVRGVPGTPIEQRERRYYIFPYDWRQDNVVHARGLEQLIDTIRRDYADPDLRVDIIAHSMGGLIARYYLRYGTVDVLDGSHDEMVSLYGTTRVRKLILLGTPNMGSASSLHAFLSGEPIGFSRIEPEVLATMGSGYQLFPHPLVTWLIDAQGHELDANLFDGATWRQFGWSVFDSAVQARVRAAHTAQPDAHCRHWRGTSTIGWSVAGASCGSCRRPSRRRRSATFSLVATVRSRRRAWRSNTRMAAPPCDCTRARSAIRSPAFATTN